MALEQSDLDAIEALISRHETKARRVVVNDTKTCARIARKHWKRRIIGVTVACVISYGCHYALQSKYLEGFMQTGEMTVLAFIEWGFSRAKEL
jgi:hypothetical protein